MTEPVRPRQRGWSRSRLVRLAAALWLVVGGALATTGVVWLVRYGGAPAWAMVPVAVGVGWAKARFALAPMARSNVRRLQDGPPRLPLYAMYRARTWLLVAGFMALGAVLRRSALPRELLGLVYLAVGVALALGSLVGLRVHIRNS